MHVVLTNEPVDLGSFGILPPGRWLCADQNAAEIALMAPRGEWRLEIWRNKECPPKERILMRAGAWGDLLFLTPVLKALKERNPGHPIYLSCFEKHHCLFEGTELVDKLFPYPLSVDVADKYDRVISLENCMELSLGHATDSFAEALELGFTRTGVRISDYRPIYKVMSDEASWAREEFFRNKRPRLGVQMFASVPNRNYPPGLWLKVFNELVNRGWEIYGFGSHAQMKHVPSIPHFRNLSAGQELGFRQAAAILSTCDAFCGIDSVWLHMCHALDIPAVGLFGPFPWAARTAHAPKTTALSGVGPCAPCYWHKHAGNYFPPNSPCTPFQKCVVLAGIPWERIVAKVDKIRP